MGLQGNNSATVEDIGCSVQSVPSGSKEKSHTNSRLSDTFKSAPFLSIKSYSLLYCF